jgi:nicotinate phosphoribosyltransferase
VQWNYDGQAEKARAKAEKMLAVGAAISEFGTRRRRSYKIQDLVVDTLVKTTKAMPGQGKVTGTSNVCRVCMPWCSYI